MHFTRGAKGRAQQIEDLFTDTFSASEGAEEGAVIGALVRGLLGTTPSQDIAVFTAENAGAMIAAAIFSRLVYDQDPRSVFILSPMAVAPNRQGQGVGQAVLRHALTALGDDGVDVAITYGDPAFYGKVGFRPLTEADAPAPLPLSQPEGWIGQSLTDARLAPLRGACTCVPALSDPAIW